MKLRILVVLLLVLSAACPGHKKPTQANDLAAASPGPTDGEVDVIFHGLIAFVPLGSATGDGMKSVFLNPAMEEHIPFVAIGTAGVYKTNTSVPDYLVSGQNGHGLAIWRIQEAKLETNIADDPLHYDSTTLGDDEQNFVKLRWVPFMDDITGVVEPYDPLELANAAATADWKHGNLTPVFDSPGHKTELWTIGERKNRPLADGVRLRAGLKDPAQPVVLSIKRNISWENIPIKGGNVIQFSAYPKTIPKAVDDDLKHFVHFYQLRTVSKSGPPPKKGGGDPTPDPARCAPVVFRVIEP